MATNLFSTYSTGENRVTASILAVLRSLSLDRMQWLIGALLEQSEFELVSFQNQPSKGGAGVPDAIIQSSCRILVETKIKRNAVRADQLKRHLERLDETTETTRLLLVLTPDDAQPVVFSSLKDNRLVWSSFAALDQAIDEMLADRYQVVSERESFLLRELQNMLMDENLISSVNDVVVVPARIAWPEYQQYHAYVCQPDRPFQQVSRLAFYAHGHIHPLVPRILEVYDHVEFVAGKHKGKLGDLVSALLKANQRKTGTACKVFFLSPPDSPDTLKLDHPIPNDLKSTTGKTTAFTQNQRYVSSERLKTARATSDLVATSNVVKEQDHDNCCSDANLLNSTATQACGVLKEYGTTTSARQIPTCELTPELLPEDRASWDAILKFAYSFDGYDYWLGERKCVDIGNSVRQEYHDTGRFQASIDILRTALFFEARRYHDNVVDQESLEYIWALISEIRRQLSQKRSMTFEEIINAKFDPEEIEVAAESLGRVGDVCDCSCEKCGNITPWTPFNKDDHCGSCTIYEHGDECDCDACEYNRYDLIEEMRMACCYRRLEELSRADQTPEVIQEMKDIQSYLGNH